MDKERNAIKNRSLKPNDTQGTYKTLKVKRKSSALLSNPGPNIKFLHSV